MNYEYSDRVQFSSYDDTLYFVLDVIDTLLNKEYKPECVTIISDKYTTEDIIKTICQVKFDDFQFDFSLIDFNKMDDSIDEYSITLFDDGEVYVKRAIDKNAEYYEHDSFMFVETDVSSDSYNGVNRSNDVMVFSINDSYR